MKPWLTTTEAAKLLGCTRSTVWAWAHNGTIPSTAILVVGADRRIARWFCEGRTP